MTPAFSQEEDKDYEWSSEDEDDYDYSAPFNGKDNAENDLVPRTFENLAQKKKDYIKKPRDETSRTPNAPW